MTSTLSKTHGSPPTDLRPTLGPYVVAWIEANVVHGEGDFFGTPFILDQWQKRFIYRLYEIDAETGDRLVRVALLGVGKGNGKSALASAIANAELAGPVMPEWDDAGGGRWIGALRNSPNIPIAAASFEQANLVYGTAATMVNEGPLAPYLEVFDTETRLKDRPGRMYRVAAQAGTNDGTLPTAFFGDELHEWEGRKERVHLVISNSLAKRSEGLNVNTSTAGANLDTLLGRMYEKGKRITDGSVDDPTFLFEWHEANPEWDLDDPTELRDAIREANPGSWINVERIAARYEIDRIPEYEFRRYHLNQWTSSAERWISVNRWDEGTAHRFTDDEMKGREGWAGVDLSSTEDVTALVYIFPCEKVEGALDVIDHYWLPEQWTRDHPDHVLTRWAREGLVELTAGNVIDFRLIGDHIREAPYEVVELGYDPWQAVMLMVELAEEGLPVAKVTQGPAVLTGPTKEFERLANAGLLHHRGSKVLRWMVQNVTLLESGDSRRPSKSRSSEKIDGVSAILNGIERWMRAEPAPEPTMEWL